MKMNHFDSKAADWDNNPGRREMALDIAAAISAHVPLRKNMSAMEFGCGTGLVSHTLLPMVGKIQAVDLSPGMIKQLQRKIEEGGLHNISAHCFDIFTDPPMEQFDLIFSAMALHHIEQTDALLDSLAEHTAPGGFIALADLDTEDGTFHDSFEGFIHHGFDREELMQKLRDRGFVETAAVTAHAMHKTGHDYPVFLITARNSGA